MSRPHALALRLPAAAALFAAIVAAGCARPPAGAPPRKQLDVKVVLPIAHLMERYEDFTGRTEAFKYVEIRPQVTGELKVIHFRDGDTVREGTLLFEIDPRLYQAQWDNAKAQHKNAVAARAKAEANLALTKADLKRAEDAYAKSVAAKADYDAAVANKEAAEASIDAAKASIDAAKAAEDLAKLNLTWTKITAPYDGRLSRRRVDPGNIVTANTTPLTTIIDLKRIYIGFDIDEQAVERRREAISRGEIPTSRDSKLEVAVGFSNDEGNPYKAVVTFSDNQVDTGTATLHIRAEMDNPLVRQGLSALIGNAAAQYTELKELRLLSPGMFARVRLPLGKQYETLLIPEEAIGSDQGHKFVFVVVKAGDKDVVQYRKIKTGPIYRSKIPQDNRVFRAVEERKPDSPVGEGIARGERVVLGGQQRIKDGDAVTAKEEKLAPVE